MKKKLSQLYYFERYLSKTLFVFILFVIALIFVRTFIFSVGIVDGGSMEPTLSNNQKFIVNRVSYLFSEPKLGDVIQVIDFDKKKLIVKRIAGLPGDIIEVEIDKQKQKINLENHEYYILGDNSKKSYDSRNYGPITREMIVGRLVFFE